MKVSLCLEGLQEKFFLFFLRENKFVYNLWTSTYLFYKSSASVNMKSATCDTVL